MEMKFKSENKAKYVEIVIRANIRQCQNSWDIWLNKTDF